MIHRSGWTFYTNLKSNRKVSITKEIGYQDLAELQWSQEELTRSILTDDNVERFERDFFAFIAEGKYILRSDFFD